MSTEPGYFQDDDLLDGCACDKVGDEVTDDELPFVVLGDDPLLIEEYKRLFSDHTKAQQVIEAMREVDGATPTLDR